MIKTEADKVAESNQWPYAMAIGYCDGRRDKAYGIKAQIPVTEYTDYANGYFRGYKDNA